MWWMEACDACPLLTMRCACRYKLGRVLWELGGSAREDPDQAQTQFESASMEECDSQVCTTVWTPFSLA